MNDERDVETRVRDGLGKGRVFPSPDSPLAHSQLPAEVRVRLPDWTAGSFYPFSGNVTGSIATVTSGLSVLSPGHKVVIRGGRLSMVVTTALAASAAGFLGLYDGDNGGLLATLSPHCSTQSAGTHLLVNEVFTLLEGRRAVGPLYIAGTQDIGVGVVACDGVLYGYVPTET